jgi:hypothetical protein
MVVRMLGFVITFNDTDIDHRRRVQGVRHNPGTICHRLARAVLCPLLARRAILIPMYAGERLGGGHEPRRASPLRVRSPRVAAPHIKTVE